MKSKGIVRNTDPVGRVVIPKEIRRSLNISEGDALEIFIDGDSIILRPYKPFCIFCGDSNNITYYRNVKVCSDCIEGLTNAK